MGQARARGTLSERKASPKGGDWKAMHGAPTFGNLSPIEVRKRTDKEGRIFIEKKRLKAGTKVLSADGRTNYVYDSAQLRRVR